MKILYAEDNNIDYLLVKSILKEHQVTRATNGKEALDLFYQGRFDLVLMNLSMPVLDGLKTTESIRELDKSTPIYMITSQYLKQQEAYNSGIDEFIVKPIINGQIKTLVDKINQEVK